MALSSDIRYGMRLAEATGLLVEDFRLDLEVPVVLVQSYPWRAAKTKKNKRYLPLVGKSEWSAKIIKEILERKFAIPRYNTSAFISTNNATASLNKWLRSEGFNKYTLHSF